MLVFLVKRNFNRSALFLLNDQKDEPKLEPAIVPEALLSDLCFGSDLFFFTFFTRAHIRFPNVSLSSSSSFFNLIRLSTLAALCCFCCYSISTHVLTFLFLRELFTCVCVCGNCRYILMRVLFDIWQCVTKTGIYRSHNYQYTAIRSYYIWHK